MKNSPKFGKDYFDELLETIKEIRLSERRLYQKITDIFESTSTDYDAKSEEAYTFFKIVQNKLHYAIIGKTASELIYERVDAYTVHMRLTNWKKSPDGKIYKYDIGIVKNYLNEEEMKNLEKINNYVFRLCRRYGI
ncbi:MAG: RhuM family protein [Coprobacillus sp.]